MSAQMYDRIVIDGTEFYLAAAPLEEYFRRQPEKRPAFTSFNSGAPDEGKEPLVYAIDDLAKAAAKGTDMQEEKEDLSVMLAKGTAGN